MSDATTMPPYSFTIALWQITAYSHPALVLVLLTRFAGLDALAAHLFATFLSISLLKCYCALYDVSDLGPHFSFPSSISIQLALTTLALRSGQTLWYTWGPLLLAMTFLTHALVYILLRIADFPEVASNLFGIRFVSNLVIGTIVVSMRVAELWLQAFLIGFKAFTVVVMLHAWLKQLAEDSLGFIYKNRHSVMALLDNDPRQILALMLDNEPLGCPPPYSPIASTGIPYESANQQPMNDHNNSSNLTAGVPE